MAKFIKKIGTIPSKYQFDLKVYNIRLNVPFEVKSTVVFQKGARRYESKNKPKLDKNNPIAEFNETLSIISTIYKDKVKGVIQESKAQVIVYLQKDEQPQKIAIINLNLEEFLNNIKGKVIQNLQCNADKTATIEFELKCTLISGNCTGQETISDISDVFSVDSNQEQIKQFNYDDFDKTPEEKHFVRNKTNFKNIKPAPALMAQIKKSEQKPPIGDNIMNSHIQANKIINNQPIQNQQQEEQKKKKVINPNMIKMPDQSKLNRDKSSTKLVDQFHQPLMISTQSQQLQKKVEQIEQEKQKLIETYSTQLQQYVRDKENDTQNIKTLENQVHKLESERDKLKLNITQNQRQIEQMQEKISTYQDDNKQLSQIIKEKLDKYKQLDEKYKQLQLQNKNEQQQKVNEQEKQNQEFKIQIREKDKQLKQYQSEIAQLNENIDKLRDQLVETRQSNLTSQSQLEQNLKNKLQQYEKEIQELKTINRQNKQQYDDQKSQLEDSQQQISQIKFQQSKIESEKTQLFQQLQEKEENEKQIKQVLDELEQDQKQSVNKYNQVLEEMKRSQEQFDLDKKTLNKRIKEKEKKIQNLETKLIDKDEEKLQSFNEYQEDIQNQKNKFEFQIKELKKRIEELQSKQEQPVVTQERNNKDVEEELMNQTKQLQQELLRKEEEYYYQIQQLQEENQNLYKELQNERTSLRQINNSNDKEMARMQVENEFLKAQLIEYEGGKIENQVDDEKVREIRHQYIQMEKQFSMQSEQYEELEKDLIEKKMKIAEYDQENQELIQKLKHRSESLKVFSQQVTKLEIELVKTKQDLGEAMNTLYEYESINSQQTEKTNLITQMESNLTFREGEKPEQQIKKKSTFGLFKKK